MPAVRAGQAIGGYLLDTAPEPFTQIDAERPVGKPCHLGKKGKLKLPSFNSRAFNDHDVLHGLVDGHAF